MRKKTEFDERQEQREADRPEIKDVFSFMDKESILTVFHSQGGLTSQGNQ